LSEPRSSALMRALELAGSIAAGRSPDEVLATVLDSAIELTKAERGFVVVRAPTGELAVRAARNYGRRGVPPSESRVSGSIVGKAVETGEPVLVASAADDPRFARTQSVRDLKIRSALVVPLVAREKVLGAVLVEDRRSVGAFGSAERKLLELVAAHAALVLDSAVERASLERELERRGRGARRFPRLVGSSPPFVRFLASLERVCESDATVLIQGESGTGKELVARTLHEHGRRAGGPFVAFNAAEIAETLVEAELFGHARGAFTGAGAAREGLLARAHGGTLFLDEVGELARPVQAKLLRFLQERTVRPVGGGEARRVDARVVAATNKDLKAAVRAGEFREDLWFRLNVVRLEPPALRERREDVVVLASHFLCAVAAEAGTSPRRLSREALAALERHAWPGNVRELENAIRRAVVLGNDPIQPEDLALGEGSEVGLAALEREAALRALKNSNGNVSRAASSLGIHRATLYRKLERWGLSVLRGPGVIRSRP